MFQFWAIITVNGLKAYCTEGNSTGPNSFILQGNANVGLFVELYKMILEPKVVFG
jgi:hypothetical protein